MKKRATGIFGLLGLLALGFAATPKSYADDGVIVYRAEGHGGRFAAAERAAKSSYSYAQRAYGGTHIYYGEGTNRNPDIYSSRVISFFVTFENPTVIHAGHGLDDADAGKRDVVRIFPRRRR